MENKKEISKTKKVSGVVLSSVLFAAISVGAGFGLANSIENIAGVDTNYNDYVQIEANVRIEDPSKDIDDAAKSVSDTLNFLGMQNAYVRTLGNEKIIINNPISSYNNDDTPILNDIDDHFKAMSSTDNKSYLDEIMNLAVPLFFDGTLDIRDAEGDAAFVYDESSIEGWSFTGTEEGGEGVFGVAPETTPEGEMRSGFLDDYIAPTNFFEEAKLNHYNGMPIIELKIARKGNNSDQYLNMFKEFDQFIDKTGQEYVVWFNYELTYGIITILDSEGLSSSESLYDYVSQKPALRPLYLTRSNRSVMSSKYSDTVEFSGDFTESQAKYFVNKINNSNSYSYTDIEVSVIINLQTKIMLAVLALILLLIILGVIFSFVAYFGLLGLLASAVFTLITMTMVIILSAIGILITGLGLISLGVVIVSAAMMLYSIIDIYKKDNEDKFISVSKVAAAKLSAIQKKLFLPLVTTILLFYGAGLILPMLIAVPLYLIVIGMVVSYVFSMILLLPMVYVTDIAIKFTRVDILSKWDMVVGFNGLNVNINNFGVESDKNKSFIGVIVTFVLLAIAIIVGGTLYGTTGSSVNSNMFGTQNYIYNVKVLQETAKLTLTTDSDFSAETYIYGAEQANDVYKNTSNNEAFIEEQFESNGIKVSKIDTVRFDEVVRTDIDGREKTIAVGSFGYQIYSKNELTNEKVESINSTISKEIKITDETGKNTTGFVIEKGMSWDGKQSTKIINYTDNQTLIKAIYALLIMSLITTFILLFVGNFGVAVAGLLSTLMESALLLSPIVIFYVPFSTIALLPVILLAGLSFRNKIVISKVAKEDEVNNGRWNRAAKNQQLSLPILSGALLGLELLLFGTYAFWSVVPMIIVTVLAPLSIYLTQQLVFPYFAELLGNRTDGKNKKKLEKDIELSKDKSNGEIREEYIEGVNM